MSGLIDLRPDQLVIVEGILAEHVPDCEVRAFGSRATCTAKDYSDLDLAVVDDGPLDRRTLGRLKEAFEESILPMRVDVVDWHAITDSFRQTIEPDCVVIQCSPKQEGWHEVEIGQIADVIGGGTPPTRDTNNFGGDIPWLTPKDLSGQHDRYVAHGARHLSQAGLDNSSAKLLPANSVLLSTRAPIGYVALAKNSIATNQGFRSLVVRDEAIPDYLYYWLKVHTEELERHASGTTFRELAGSSLKKIRVRLPQLDEQRGIADVLGALDDKIELNRRMSETLDAMARALIRSWFVDFDPVRAKAEGRPSGLPPDLDALFPNSFEPSELGNIPAGWQPSPLGDVMARRQKRISPDQMLPGTPYIGLEHMPKRSITLSAWGTTDRLASTKFGFERGDILFGRRRPYFHKVGVAPLSGVCSTDVLVLTPNSHEWFGFVLGHVSSDRFVDYADATSTGTRMPRTTWRDMARYTVPLPDRFMAAAFDDWTRPWVDRVVAATHVSHELAALRDTLLTNLLSDKFPLTYEAEAR